MVAIIAVVIMVITGILFLVLPEDKLVKKDKLKPDENFEQLVKNNRRYGWLMLGLAAFFFWINIL